MEPVKFEKYIKQQLQKREIKPSDGSWEKLQERLGQNERPSKTKFWRGGAVAAVAIVFFVIGTFFNSPVQQRPRVVDAPQPEIIKIESPEIVKQDVMAAEEKAPVSVQNSVPKKLPKKAISERKEIAALIPEKQVEKQVFETIEKTPGVISKEEDVVETTGKTPVYSLDTEVDALLLAANVEIENDPAFEVQTVNAGDLLNEVEYELEMSFRQKVFEVLKDSYSKARTAVANRN